MRLITSKVLILAFVLALVPGFNARVEASTADYAPAVLQINTLGITEEDELYGASGTGFFISWDGAILTNYHVIEDAYYGGVSETILLCPVVDDRSTPSCTHTAEVWAYDETLDIALLFPKEELDADYNVVADVSATFVTENYIDVSNFSPELGEDVFILGFPDADLSDSITLTEGIVSGFTGDYFITDATINPGNSGGPVFSYYDGEVLGVATMVSTEGLGGNYGYAISNEAIYTWFLMLVDAQILNADFVNTMFSDETGYELGDTIFSDVSFGDTHSEAIAYLKDEGIVGGYPDGTFLPEGTLNRAELLKILVEGAGYTPDETVYKDCFLDVGSDWYAKYACFAKEQGWVEGYADGTFQPSKNVNKVEAIKMMLEVFDVEMSEVSSDPFSDVPYAEWFAKYIQTAKDWGILEEEEGAAYYPGNEITRGGVSENLYRLLY